MKKEIITLAALTVLTLALTGCTDKSSPADDADTYENTDIIVSETVSDNSTSDTPADTEVNETSASTAEETAAKSETLSAKADSDLKYIPPDEDFIKTLSGELDNDMYGEIIFTADENGGYSLCKYDVFYYSEEQMMHDLIAYYLSEEGYEEYCETAGENEYESYEEYYENYQEELKGYLGDDFEYYMNYTPEEGDKKIYYHINFYSYIDEEETTKYSNEQIISRVIGRIFERLNSEPETDKIIEDTLKNGSSVIVYASADRISDEIIELSSFVGDTLAMWGSDENTAAYLEEKLPIPDGEGIILYDTFIPADTDKLCISSMSSDMMLMGSSEDFMPEDAIFISLDHDRLSDEEIAAGYDIAEIARSLPHLKELHIYRAICKNTDALKELTELETLTCYLSDEPDTDIPFLDMPNLKNLRLYGDYDDYSFLEKMPQLENVATHITKEMPLDTLFNCPAITELVISEKPDTLEGIQKLTGLKRLTLEYEDPDVKPLETLKNLEYLEIYAHTEVKNISCLGKITSLKELFFHSIENYDWEFLSELKNVRILNVMYVEDIYNEDIKQMPQLEELHMTQVLTTYSLIGEMPNLKYASAADILGSPDNFKGSDTLEYYYEMFDANGDYNSLANCPKLKEIMLYGDRMYLDIKNISGLPLEKIYIDISNVENAEELANIKTLKGLTVVGTPEDAGLEEKLRNALSDCNIRFLD